MPNRNPYRRQVLNLDTGEKYPSIRHLAKEKGINMGALATAMAKGHRYRGDKYQYLDPPRPDAGAEEGAHEIKVLEVLQNGPLSLAEIAQQANLDSKTALAALNRQNGICVRKQGMFWELQTPPNTEEVETFNSQGRRPVPLDYWRQLETYTAQQLGAKSVSFLGKKLVAMYLTKGLEDIEVGRYVTIAKKDPSYFNQTSCITSLNRETGGDWVSVTTRSCGKKKFRVYPGELEAVGQPVPLEVDLGEELRAALPSIRAVAYKANIGRAKQASIICKATGLDEVIVWLLEAYWNPAAQNDQQTLLDWIATQPSWEGFDFYQRHRLVLDRFKLRSCLSITYHPNFPGLK